MKLNNIAIILLLAITIFIGCDDDDPKPENPEELITTVRVTMRDAATSTNYVQEFRDLDGDGGEAPVVTTESIPMDATFLVSVEFLNEADDPAEDITEEVLEEAEEHQVFFVIEDLNLTNTYEDQDANGNPIGISNSMVSGSDGQGTLRVVLRHEPDKFASGVSAGDITNAGGETDVDVTFNIEIQ